MDREQKLRELEALRYSVRKLETELAAESPTAQWPPEGYYLAYHVVAGFVLGIFGAATSLLFNIVGATLVGKYPLELIRVYLTFPLGESALAADSGITLAIGCCLYLATGMLLGIPFHLALTRLGEGASFATRFVFVSVMALAIWVINFYGILWWLQPLLFGGTWIVDMIPIGVAALTHLVFGWTMLLVAPWGAFVAYRPPLETT